MTTQSLKHKFFDISHMIQEEFDRNLEKYGSKIQCRRGCSQCCSQIFNITLLDGYVIAEHVKNLPSERQKELKKKAKEYLGIRSKTGVLERKKSAAEFSLKPRIPCPALGNEGECTIYEARPVICRRFGIPIYDYKNPEKVYACELNFKDGEEIDDRELIPNQTALGKKWDELKEEFRNKYRGQKSFTTIAEAILKA
jgi:Fe-S-cluster containining protein